MPTCKFIIFYCHSTYIPNFRKLHQAIHRKYLLKRKFLVTGQRKLRADTKASWEGKQHDLAVCTQNCISAYQDDSLVIEDPWGYPEQALLALIASILQDYSIFSVYYVFYMLSVCLQCHCRTLHSPTEANNQSGYRNIKEWCYGERAAKMQLSRNTKFVPGAIFSLCLEVNGEQRGYSRTMQKTLNVRNNNSSSIQISGWR